MWLKSGWLLVAALVMSPKTCALIGDGGKIEPDAGVPDVDAGTSRTDCPTGKCDDDSGNGKGIYVVEGGNYCLGGPWCPEAFFNTALGGVELELRNQFRVRETRRLPVSAKVDGHDVILLDIISSEGLLLVHYREPGGTDHQLAGADLTRLKLFIAGSSLDSSLAAIELTFGRTVNTGTGVMEYQVFFNGKLYCSDTEMVAFLPNKRVDGRTGFVTDAPGATTMACRSGAIVTCMEWGYRPWLGQAGIQEAFGSCIHAKRAAYFVGKNDFNCYTSNSTAIQIQDKVGIKSGPLRVIEATWTPNGAVCLSPQNRRHASGPPLPTQQILPPCGPADQPWQGSFATAPVP